MISVAICTCNGAQYVADQILSIINQSTPVDEIIVCDDQSSDQTVSIINRILEESDVSFNVIINDNRLGVNQNFKKALSMCHGDIIFMSDQDDIWHKDKVKKVIKWFDTHPKKDVVFTNATFIDSNNNLIYDNTDLFSAVAFTHKARFCFNIGLGLELFAKNNRATGATMALRGTFLNHINIIESQGVFHDQLICMAALNHCTLGYIPKHLVQYRIHPSQTVGLLKWIQSPPCSSDGFSPLSCPVLSNLYSIFDNYERFSFMGERERMIKDKSKRICIGRYLSIYGRVGVLLFVRDRFALISNLLLT